MSSVCRKMAAALADGVVWTCPNAFLKILVSRIEKRCPEQIVSQFNKPSRNWSDLEIPDRISGFEDLSFLFWNTQVSRGLLRQDLDEASLLYKTVKGLPTARGVEIGRYNGGSTILICAALPEDGRLLSIDICPRDDEALKQVLERLGLEQKAELLVCDANTVERKDLCDFAFIDGDHSYEGAKKDHLKWGRVVRAGGFIIHHDMGNHRRYATQWPELRQLRDDILRHQAGAIEVAGAAGSMLVFRKVGEDWPVF